MPPPKLRDLLLFDMQEGSKYHRQMWNLEVFSNADVVLQNPINAAPVASRPPDFTPVVSIGLPLNEDFEDWV